MNSFRFSSIALFVFLFATSIGCGPIQSTQTISEATVALERARVVEADLKAPYEYYNARFYLHKSEEEWGYSDFEASYKYAKQAQQAAEAAILKAKEDPWTGSPVDQERDNDSMKDRGAESIDMRSVKPSKTVSKKKDTKKEEAAP